MSYYSDDEDIDVHIRRRRDASPARGPPPVHYVEARAPRPRSYYATGPSYLAPERTMITTRSRSRERSRERRSSPPSQAPQPIVINNYNNHSSDDDSYIEDRTVALSRHHSHHSHSRPRAPSSGYMTREEYELEEARREIEEMKLRDLRKRDDYELSRTRRELEEIKAIQSREKEDRNLEKHYKDHAELREAKRELDDIKRREQIELEQKRIKKELELKRLEEEKREHEEKERREKAEKEAIERYKLKEAERMAKEKKEKELAEKEYQRRLQEDLIRSGVDEKDIAAIVKKEKIKKEKEQTEKARPTYTRMARRHLSVETLRVYGIDFDYDQDPNYFIIKRWVPEEEQDILWRHTRVIREKRSSKVVLQLEDGKHHHHGHRLGEPEFEWVRKKERKRSKSPGLLMYLAGAK